MTPSAGRVVVEDTSGHDAGPGGLPELSRMLPPDPATILGAGRRRSSRLRWLVWLAAKLYPFALLYLVWREVALRELVGNSFVLPSPSSVWESGVERVQDGSLADAIRVTLGRVLVAYGISLACGVGLGALIGRVDPLRRALRPLAAFAFPVPKIAIYPALVITFGLGSASKIALGVSEAVLIILLATAAGTSQVEPRLLWCARSLGTPRRWVLTRVILPAALPVILTGARIALVGAIVSIFLGEMIVGSDGLGNMMAIGWRLLETPDMYLAIITISLIGFSLDRLFLLARSRLLRWGPQDDR